MKKRWGRPQVLHAIISALLRWLHILHTHGCPFSYSLVLLMVCFFASTLACFLIFVKAKKLDMSVVFLVLCASILARSSAALFASASSFFCFSLIRATKPPPPVVAGRSDLASFTSCFFQGGAAPPEGLPFPVGGGILRLYGPARSCVRGGLINCLR